jgi:Na+-transporting NADH:ubiquinone oxidoreductase subunit B
MIAKRRLPYYAVPQEETSLVKFLKQPMMRRVLYALVPIYLYGFWMYGLRLLASSLVVFILGIGTEWFFERKKSGKVSEAALVTCALFSLAFPPKTPLWMLAVGIVFAMSLGKAVYGGFGRNIFNPAITGRTFVYISFAVALNQAYTSFGSFGSGVVDVVAAATPLGVMRSGGKVSLFDLLFGLKAGALGEGMVILVAAAAVWLIATKTASWRIILSSCLAAALLNGILLAAGVAKALPMESLLAGSFLFVTVFMATDPVSAPKRPASHFVYGALFGLSLVMIRSFSAFPEGTSFALLFANTFACLIDIAVDSFGESKAGKPKADRPATSKGGAA